jgi:hypothetical protein
MPQIVAGDLALLGIFIRRRPTGSNKQARRGK